MLHSKIVKVQKTFTRGVKRLESIISQNTPKNVCIVAHGRFLKILLSHILYDDLGKMFDLEQGIVALMLLITIVIVRSLLLSFLTLPTIFHRNCKFLSVASEHEFGHHKLILHSAG